VNHVKYFSKYASLHSDPWGIRTLEGQRGIKADEKQPSKRVFFVFQSKNFKRRQFLISNS
jgi:hypothetical protein